MKKLLLSLTMLVLVLVGCSSTSSSSSVGDTVSYTHSLGTVEIPTDPQRIVSEYYVGELLELDANLVGADLTYTSSAWTDQITEKEIVDVAQSAEKIASLNPDLIITFKPETYDTYSAIAPTVYIEYGKYTERELMKELGTITNRVDNATAWETRFDEQMVELAEVFDKTKTYSIVEMFGSDLTVFGNTWGRGGNILYDELQLNVTEAAQKDIFDTNVGYLTVNYESLPSYVGDVLFMVDPAGNADGEEFINSDVYKNLEPVKNNEVYIIDSSYFGYTDPLSMDMQIEFFKNNVK